MWKPSGMIKDWTWDTEGYPRGLINADRSVRIARDARESTHEKSVYEMRYQGTIYKIDVSIDTEVTANTTVVSFNYSDVKKSVESYNCLQNSLHPYEGSSLHSKRRSLLICKWICFRGKSALSVNSAGTG